MVKGLKCIVSNCKNMLTGNGRICGTHRWRKKKFNSYDLPSYQGTPNYLIEEEYPEGTVKKCKLHGFLTEDQTYVRYYKGNPNYSCKPCYQRRHLKKFELNEKEFEELYKKQNGVCAICKKTEKVKANNSKDIKRIALDHCHVSNKRRGLLCSACNSMLGYAEDSIEILQSGINYLKEFA